MKKTLLLGTALVLGVVGFAQSTAKKAINPKYLQKKLAVQKTVAEPLPSGATGVKVAKKTGHQSTLATCAAANKITTSWNCFGVGGGATTSEQNCLSYNKDLNVVTWTQRGSKTWPIVLTSGYLQTTVIDATTSTKIDSIADYKGSSTTHEARYPGGVLLNPTTNTTHNYKNAFAVASGPTTDGTNWSGTAYTAKPIWSTSAANHTASAADSLFAATHTGKFGNVTAATYIGSPSNDMTAMPDGKTVKVIGDLYDPLFVSVTNANATRKGIIATGTLDATGKIVNWTVDSSLVPNVRKMADPGTGSLGWDLNSPRMAFSPDGMTGYVLFIGRLDTDYGNKSDSAMTPIVYKSTDAGATWTQKLAGYDWVCKHPEVLKNVGELTGRTDNYTFDAFGQGADLTVDANGLLHYVCTVAQPFHGTDIDSLGVFTYSYDYDGATYHPIIWDFMTDGNEWKTMMVDSILSAPLSSSSADSTNGSSPMGGSMILGVSSHITVSRSTDGTKVFYGWADSDPNILGPNATGATYNTSPDILMKAYDVNTNKVSGTKNVTGGLGNCFYPYLADQSYFDASQNAWVVPAMYTVGGVILTSSPVIIYDASSEADYYYTNCGTFGASDFTGTAWIYAAPSGTVCADPSTVGISKVNAFAASINNYPNPFSNTTTIAVTLTESKSFNVNVYNAIGTLVYSKKVNGNVGENNVTFDAGSLSSGVYYYTVNAGNQQATKKMVIQK